LEGQTHTGLTVSIKDLIILVQFLVILYLLYRDQLLEWGRLRRIKQSGDEGEKAVSDALDDLEDVFAVYHNLQGQLDHQRYEIDHLLLTHQGILLIETKNMRGTIVARKEAWVQIKASGSGKSYEREFRSPIQQIERTSRIFENLMGSRGVRLRVQPVVVFSSPDTDLKLKDQKYPVLTLDKIQDFVRTYSRDVPLTTRQLRKAKEVLDEVYGF
jgi:hypothetical protein